MVAYNNYHVTGCHFVSKFRSRLCRKKPFYNLPEDKKKRILDAAAEEIVRVPASEMSINKIIQKADISREAFISILTTKRPDSVHAF